MEGTFTIDELIERLKEIRKTEDYTLRMKVFGNAYDCEGRELIIDEAANFCKSHSVTDIKYVNNDRGELWKIVATYREIP